MGVEELKMILDAVDGVSNDAVTVAFLIVGKSYMSSILSFVCMIYALIVGSKFFKHLVHANSFIYELRRVTEPAAVGCLSMAQMRRIRKSVEAGVEVIDGKPE
ncbi:MAG: hypothetical protein ACXABY_14315 [Candidatus Thorarchaeota archaeon]|jgi:hypothetical protein